jgi:hypothetical protein
VRNQDSDAGRRHLPRLLGSLPGIRLQSPVYLDRSQPAAQPPVQNARNLLDKTTELIRLDDGARRRDDTVPLLKLSNHPY